MKYIIYCRKSSEDENRQIQSLETQERMLLEYASKFNLEVVEVIKESRSAKNDGNRPLFDAMLKKIQLGEVDGILVLHIDRLSRNGIESGKITKIFELGLLKEIRTPSKIISSLQDMLYVDFDFVFAAHYSRQLSIKTREGIATKLSKGEYPGCGPLGYINKSGRIYPDPKKAHFVQEAFKLYSTGKYTPKEMSEYFYERGLRTRCGYKVHKSQIYHMLKNPAYYGAILCKGVIYKGIHEPLVSKELFDQVNDMLDGKTNGLKSKHDFLFKSYLKCAVCGCAMTTTMKKNKYVYYYCTNGKKKCSQHKKYLKEEKMSLLFGDFIKNFTPDQKTANLSLEIYMDDLKNKPLTALDRKAEIKKQIDEVDKKISVLLDLRLNESVDEDTFKIKQKKLKEEKTNLQIKFDNIKVKDPTTTLELLVELKNQACSLEEMWNCKDFQVRKDLLNSVLWNFKIENHIIASQQLKLPYAYFEKVGKNSSFREWLRD